MELLLTPVVNSLLSRFVKGVGDGTSGSQLRASLSGGSVVLHNLELNLESVLGDLPITVHRAFARQLKINIAWTALAAQPIQVVLDTVEVVVALSERCSAASKGIETPSVPEEDASTGSWVGSITSLLLRTLFNVSVSVNNMVVKYLAPTSVATLTCQSIHMSTAGDGWQAEVLKPESWLKKILEVRKAALWLDERKGNGRVESRQPPLLYLPRLDAGALVPIFAVIDGTSEAALGEALRAVVNVALHPVESAVNELQIEWLHTFLLSLSVLQVNRAGKEESESAPLSPRPPKPHIQSVGERRRMERAAQAINGKPAGGAGWVASGIAGAAGKAWRYITDEAAMLDATAAAPAAPRASMALQLNLHLQGGVLWALHAEAAGERRNTDTNVNRQQEATAEFEASSPSPFLQDLEQASPQRSSDRFAAISILGLKAQPGASVTATRSPELSGQNSLTTPTRCGLQMLALLRVQGFQASLEFNNQVLESVDASLVKASLCREVKPDDSHSNPTHVTPFTVVEDEVLGLYPPTGMTSPALRREGSSESLAARLQWRGNRDASHQTTSVTLGRVSVVYPAGFASELLLFVAKSTPSGVGAIVAATVQEGQNNNEQAESPPKQAEDDRFSQLQPAQQPPLPSKTHLIHSWLQTGPVISFAVLSLHAAALSAGSSISEAVAISLERLSAHLGPVKPATRPGSVTAELYSLRDVPTPRRGLRLALAGIQIGVATRWMPAASRPDDGLPECVQAITNPVEVQVLVSVDDWAKSASQMASRNISWPGARPLAAPQAASPAAAAVGRTAEEPNVEQDVVLAAVSSGIDVGMSGDQAAALAAVLAGLAAEATRKLQAPLPARSFSPEQNVALGKFPAIAAVSLEVGAVSLVAASQETENFKLADGRCLTAPSGGPIQVLVGSPKLLLGVSVGEVGRADEAAAAISIQNPLLWASPNIGLFAPGADVQFGRVLREARHSSLTRPHRQPSGSLVASIGNMLSPGKLRLEGPPANQLTTKVSQVKVEGEPCIRLAELQAEIKTPRQPGSEGEQVTAGWNDFKAASEDDLPTQVFAAAASASLELSFSHWQSLLVFGAAFAMGPALPQLPGYPPAGLPVSSKPLHVHASLASASGWIAGTQADSLLDIRASDLTLATEQRSQWKQESTLNPDGYWADGPASRKFNHLSIANLELGFRSDAGNSAEARDGIVRFVGSSEPGDVMKLTVQVESGRRAAALYTVVLETLPLDLCLTSRTASYLAAFILESRASYLQGSAAKAADTGISVTAEEEHGRMEQAKLRLRLAIPGIALALSGTLPQQRLLLSTSDAVLVLNEALTPPWGSFLGTRGDLSLRDAQIMVFDPGLSQGGAQVVHPFDIHAAIRLSNGGDPSTALIVDSPVVAAQMSPAMLTAISRLLMLFIKAPTAYGSGCSTREPAVSRAASRASSAQLTPDDLRCGLFETAEVAASRPGRMRLSWGDKQPGRMPWSGEGESWICWRYPHSCRVTAVLVALPPTLLASADLELLAYSKAADSFVPASVHLTEIDGLCAALPNAHDSGLLLTVKGQPLEAEEWQLCWECTAEGAQCRAAFVLQHVYVNPRIGLHLDRSIPPPLPVPFTLGASIKHCSLQILVDQVSGSKDLSPFCEIACARLSDLKAVVHSWTGKTAVRCSAKLEILHTDEAALSEETLLEPSNFSVTLEKCTAAAVKADTEKRVPLHLEEMEDLALPPPQPVTPGTLLCIRFVNTPTRITISELGLHALTQTHRSAFPLWEEAISEIVGRGERSPLDSERRNARAWEAGILVHNQTCLALEIGQAGCTDTTSLPANSHTSYLWASPAARLPSARRLLQMRSVAGTRPGGLEAAISEQGEALDLLAERRQSHSKAGTSGQVETQRPVRSPEWSSAFDVMSAGMSVQRVMIGPGCSAVVAIHVRKEGFCWRTEILPGCSIVSRCAENLQISIIGSPDVGSKAARNAPLPSQPEKPPAADRSSNAWCGLGGGHQAPPLHTEIMLPAHGDPVRVLPLLAQQGGMVSPLSSVRVWLGAGNGWSHPVPLDGNAAQVVSIQAAGFGGADPPIPRSSESSGGDLGILHAKFTASTSDMTLTFWPPYFLGNEMPYPVAWRVFGSKATDLQEVPRFFTVQPGEEVPLHVSGRRGTLAFRLCSNGKDGEQDESNIPGCGSTDRWQAGPVQSSAASPGLWSRDLDFSRESGSYGWGLSSADDSCLPGLGQCKVVEVPHKKVSLAVELAAEEAALGVPCMRLRVLPAAVLQNCTQLDLVMECIGGVKCAVEAGSLEPLDWQPLRQRPQRALLSHVMTDGTQMTSEQFALAPRDVLLAMRPLPSAIAATGRSPSDQPVLYLSARVDVQQHPVLSGPPLLETVHVTITPGCFISNLLQRPLQIHFVGTVPQHNGTKIDPQETAAVTQFWKEPRLSSQRSRDLELCNSSNANSNPGCVVSIFDPGGMSDPASKPSHKQPGEEEGSAESTFPDKGFNRETVICLTAPQGRRRLILDDGECSVMATCRVLAVRGHLHAVFFQDRQPPVVLSNLTPVPLEVGYFLPEVNKLGEVQHEYAGALFKVSAGSSCDSVFKSGFESESTDEQEDEESFLERVTGESSSSAGYLGKLKVRELGSDTWSGACDVEPGQHTLGEWGLCISQCCASIHCEFTAGPPQSRSALEDQAAMGLSVECEDLQVCLFDDERRRWHGPSPENVASEPIAALPAEIFCISVCGLSLRFNQQLMPDAGPPRLLSSLRCTAQSFQIDSYLQTSSHPVVCCTVPGRIQALQGVKEDAPAAPILLDVQVAHATTASGRSFRNTWVPSLSLRLPTVAFAVDDALVAFTERAAALLATPVPPEQQKEYYIQSPAAPQLTGRSGSLVSPSKSPYFDLSRLDSLDGKQRHVSLGSPSPLGSTFPQDGQLGIPGEMRASQSPTPALQASAASSGLSSRPEGAVPEGGQEAIAWAGLQVELFAEAIAASASRLLVEEVNLGRMALLLDLHVSQSSRHIPIAIDTHRTPLTLPPIQSGRLLFRPSVMLQGLLAHYAAETLLNAPALLGSLDLLLNPTGLVRSVGQGFEDLVALPLAALEARSPSQFIAGLGLGSASLVRHVSGWTLTSISGFSSAFSRVLQRSLSVHASGAQVLPVRNQGGLMGLAGGLTSGVTGLYRAPLAGYGRGSGSGLAWGLGRGILGAVGLPLSGALDLVSSVSAGIAATTGVQTPRLRRPGRQIGDVQATVAPARFREMVAMRNEHYVGHCFAEEALVVIEGSAALLRLESPALLQTKRLLYLFDESGLRVILTMSMTGALLQTAVDGHRFVLFGRTSGDHPTKQVQVQVKLGLPAWHLWLPLLRAVLDDCSRPPSL